MVNELCSAVTFVTDNFEDHITLFSTMSRYFSHDVVLLLPSSVLIKEGVWPSNAP